MVRETNKMVKRANKKIKPVILPTQLDSSKTALNDWTDEAGCPADGGDFGGGFVWYPGGSCLYKE